jgi:hypothetical protein
LKWSIKPWNYLIAVTGHVADVVLPWLHDW